MSRHRNHRRSATPQSVKTQTHAAGTQHAAGTHLSEDHLSENQIDDCLLGDLAAGPAAHLAVCPLCTDRVASAAAPFTSFQTVGNAWSERLSAALPAPAATRSRPAWQQYAAFAAPCLVLFVGLAVIRSSYPGGYLGGYSGGSAPQSAPSVTLSDASRQSRVSADDRMLDAIDADLSPDADSPANLGLRTVSTSTQTSTPISVRD